MSAHAPIVLFGAFDRHNFGDLLFAHVAAALLDDSQMIFAGLAQRDLRLQGGHRVVPISRLVAEWSDRPINILHVGGEILDCDAWEAAVMLLAPDEARQAIAHLDRDFCARLQWAHDELGRSALAPYCIARREFPAAASVIYQAVGGTGLASRDSAMRTEVLDKLRQADSLTVRDCATQAELCAAGITAQLLPDSAVMVAHCFGARIAAHGERGEVARVRRLFPDGFIAVQFSADFGDDATLGQIASSLRQVARATGWGCVFFRAGAAPWHDETACYERILGYLEPGSATIFRSLVLWDICALIARSHGYVGSSLHGRILAMAYGLPRLNLRHPSATAPGKQAAFAATWDTSDIPGVVMPADLAEAFAASLIACNDLDDIARTLVERYRTGFEMAVRSVLR